jgi:hypothetical protein
MAKIKDCIHWTIPGIRYCGRCGWSYWICSWVLTRLSGHVGHHPRPSVMPVPAISLTGNSEVHSVEMKG